MPKVNPKTHCSKPDRHEPRLQCGYPLPCPYHPRKRDLFALTLSVDGGEVTISFPTANASENRKRLMKWAAELVTALANDEPLKVPPK